MHTRTPHPSECASCRTPPAAVPDTGTLYLSPPAAEPFDALRDYLRAAGLDPADPTPGALAVPRGPGLLSRLAGELPDVGLVRGVVGKLLEMARDLGIRTVAEGIETAGEWAWVRDHGADYVQGFLFARPASPPPRVAVPAAGVRSAAPARAG